MRDEICGHCANWRCDDPEHLVGHCIINRMTRFHGELGTDCTKFVQQKNIKNCCTCIHRDLLITQEPCIDCRFTENWKEDKQEDEKNE